MKRAGMIFWKKMMSVILSIVLIVGMVTGNNSYTVKADTVTIAVKLQVTVKGFSGTEDNAGVIGMITLQDTSNPPNEINVTLESIADEVITYAADIEYDNADDVQEIAYKWMWDGEVLLDGNVNVQEDESGEGNQEQVDTATLCSVWFKDGETIHTEYVREGNRVTEPDSDIVPEKEGYVFDGWVTQEDGTQKFNFENGIMDATSIYASWIEETPDENPDKTPDEEQGETPDGNPDEDPDKTPGENPDGTQGENPDIEQMVEKPVASLSEGFYVKERKVRLSCDTKGAEIYYTIDGSEPTTDSIKYEGAIWVKGKAGTSVETVIKAIAVKGEKSSEIAEFTYTVDLPVKVSVEINDNEKGNVTFLYEDDNAETVYVSGSFNDFAEADVEWQMQTNEDGFWELTKELDSGVYSYVLIVDGEEKIDPNNDAYYPGLDDENKKNKLVVPGTVTSPVINEDSVTFYYPVSQLPDDVTKVSVNIYDDNNGLETGEMRLTADGTHYTYTAPMLDEGIYRYEIEVERESSSIPEYFQDYYNMNVEADRGYTYSALEIDEHFHHYDGWTTDADKHWHECRCGEKTDIADHVPDNGTVTTQPTQSSTGIMTYSCVTCKAVLRTEVIAATGATGTEGGSTNNNGNNSDGSQSISDENNDNVNSEENGSDDESVNEDEDNDGDSEEDESTDKKNSKTDSASDTDKSESNSNTSNAGKDNEPRTGERSHVEIYASIAMIAGLSYIRLYFENGKKGMTEKEKKELLAMLVSWAKKGKRIRKYVAMLAMFLLLAYYHSIGKCLKTKGGVLDDRYCNM